MTAYSNPRMEATIENWPHGSKRVTATFVIEKTKQGERAVRTTTGAPKKLTYSVRQRIVDGDDGRTYIACFTMYGFVNIMRGDMKYQHEAIHQGDPRHGEMVALFD